ncbi:MAG: hypothetical protein GX537_04745 [Actinobacteria bacterium]|nr:hypothetical protein [Actinomycetota bacterium]
MTRPVALHHGPTLADALRELTDAARSGAARCPWCTSRSVRWTIEEGWPARDVLCCDACGSRLELDRPLRKKAVA